MSSTIERSVETLFAAYVEAWRHKDAAAIAALHTEDGVLHLHVGSPPAAGRAAIQQSCEELFASLDFQGAPTRIHLGAEHWVMEWVMTAGEHAIDCVDVIVLRDGLVARKDGYLDVAQAGALLAGQ